VTSRLLAARFGVSEQQANARIRRLVAAGLVSRTAGGFGQAYAVALTRRGTRVVGLPERRAPRTDAQRVHELAIVELVGRLERRLEREAVGRVLTERECRERQGLGLGRYSVAAFSAGAFREEQRWPDVVIEGPQRKAAFEVEFSPKGAERLRSILDAYATSAYADVCFLVTSPAVARVVARWRSRNGVNTVRVLPWIAAPDDVRSAVGDALAEPGAAAS
jgi:hypothetical protein